MVFDRALTDPKIGGDVLARVSGEDQTHDFALAARKFGKAAFRAFAPKNTFRNVFRLFNGSFDACY